MPIDHSNVEVVGIQISADGNRVWVCVNGECVLRVKGIKHSINIRDDREAFKEEQDDDDLP